MAKDSQFVHLHVHSDNSLLDGGSRVDQLVDRAVDLGMPALALTDHGAMYGAWEFQEKATKRGIKPIVGMEAYVAPGHRADREARTPGGKPYYHLVLLAENLKGYRNLVKLSSLGFKEGFYYAPRLDREIIERHSEGLIVSSACLAGEVAQWIEAGDEAHAREVVDWYANTFPGRYYLEVQGHDSGGQKELNEAVFRLADEAGLPVVATNDAHFLTPEDHQPHDVLICIGMKKDRDDPARLHYDRGLYFKTADEMASRFAERPEALENTVKIADRVGVQFEKKYHVPNFPIPDEERGALRRRVDEGQVFPEPYVPNEQLGEDEKEQRVLEAALLRELAFRGAEERYGTPLSDEVRERIEYELSVISRPETDYSGYHLITADFIGWAKKKGISVGPGRGSAAGSLVCYALGITDVDPLQYDLLFERFLNPDRVSMPDIDVDFDYERRGEVIEYVREKYGSESVCQIITFGTMKSRAVIRDVGRVLGFTPGETDRIAKMIPNQPNFSLSVEEAVEKVGELAELYRGDPRYREMLDYAMRLEGLKRHSSTHAAGVVIAPGPVDDYVPVAMEWSTDSKGERVGSAVSQYDMNCLERAGMLKMDFLGLKTLTVIDDARRMAELRHDVKLDPIAFPKDDAETFRMIRQGLTAGVFQLESSLATDKLVAMRADSFDDLVAINALLRPGPLDSGMTDRYIRRKRGEEEVDYPHPLLETPLQNTQGIIVYQEQVMRAAQLLAGYSLAEADVMRKAVGKKDADLIEKEIGKFIERCVDTGTTTRQKAEEIGALIRTFGRYGFNKSHSVAYAELAYQTAYLKAHYPAEFMAALLSSEIGGTDKVVEYLNEAREMDIPVLPPDVNVSGYKFVVVDGDEGQATIRFGLGAIRSVGSGIIGTIVRAREEGGPFSDFFDFVERCASSGLNRRVLEALICAGACDGFAENRAQLLAGVDQALAAAAQARHEMETGQINLFGEASGNAAETAITPSLPPVPAFPDRERLAREKEVLGIYVSGHPLEQVAELARAISTHSALDLKEYQEEKVRLAGVVTDVNAAISKRTGKEWAKVVVEDLTGAVEVLVFGDTWSRYRNTLTPGAPVVIEGKMSDRDRDSEKAAPLFLDRVQPLSEAISAGEVSVKIRLDERERADKSSMERVREILGQHAGRAPVYIEYVKADGEAAGMRKAKSRIQANPELVSQLRAILGRDRISFTRVLDQREAPGRRSRRGTR